MSDPKAHLRYVYFMRPIGGDGRIKIGCSYKPAARLLALSVWTAYPLEFVGVAKGSFDAEHLLHDYFHADRLHGEWFRSSPELLAVIKMMGLGASASDALDALNQRTAA